MAIGPNLITDLHGIQNGYAVFATRKGKERKGKERINVTASLIAMERLSSGRNFRALRCSSAMSDIFNAAQPHRIILDIGCSTPNVGHGLPSARIGGHSPYQNMTGFSIPIKNRCRIQDRAGRKIISEKYGRIGRTGDNFIVENLQTGYLGRF